MGKGGKGPIGLKVFVIETFSATIAESPLSAAGRPGVDDSHVGAWLAGISFISGVQKSEEGLYELWVPS
jgi:hypothetical protein